MNSSGNKQELVIFPSLRDCAINSPFQWCLKRPFPFMLNRNSPSNRMPVLQTPHNAVRTVQSVRSEVGGFSGLSYKIHHSINKTGSNYYWRRMGTEYTSFRSCIFFFSPLRLFRNTLCAHLYVSPGLQVRVRNQTPWTLSTHYRFAKKKTGRWKTQIYNEYPRRPRFPFRELFVI